MYELARLNPGENTATVEHQNSISNSAESFQFGPKPQIAAHHPVCREGQRILNFNNSFVIFQIQKMTMGTKSFGWAHGTGLTLDPATAIPSVSPKPACLFCNTK
jgi:hypothetical protein